MLFGERPLRLPVPGAPLHRFAVPLPVPGRLSGELQLFGVVGDGGFEREGGSRGAVGEGVAGGLARLCWRKASQMLGRSNEPLRFFLLDE